MKTLSTIIGVVMLIMASMIGYLLNSPEIPLGSVQTASEYHATSTRDMTVNTQQLIQNGISTLGSVVIASSSVTSMSIWNATSTTDVDKTILTTFDASSANGTYTFDAVMTRGIVVDLPTGFDGDYVITFR